MTKKITNLAEKNRVVAAVENIYNEFEAFGKAQDLMQEKMDRGFAELKLEIQGIDKRLIRVEGIVLNLEKRVGGVEHGVGEMKEEIQGIRRDIARGVDDKKYKELKARVEVLEQKVGV